MINLMSSSVSTVSALCQNLSELGVLLLCRCRDVTPSKKFMSSGLDIVTANLHDTPYFFMRFLP